MFNIVLCTKLFPLFNYFNCQMCLAVFTLYNNIRAPRIFGGYFFYLERFIGITNPFITYGTFNLFHTSTSLLSVCSQICEQIARNIRRVSPPLIFRNKPQMKHSYLRRSVWNIKRPCNVGNYISDLSFVNIKIVNNMSSCYSVFAHNTSCKGTKNISRH